MKGQTTRPGSLPVQLTSFVGRHSDLTELCRLLAETRLVTIAGTAGLGKTRLAVEVASRMAPELEDGAWFVGLSALAEPALVAREVAVALGIREQLGASDVDRLVAHVQERRMLLVLDNCEHLLDTSAGLVEVLLRAGPGLRLLVTSHEPLRVPGERVWRIAPLPVPASASAFEALAASEAVRLFGVRAMLVQPRFRLSPANLRSVGQICRRLDGIPLAIELAAARLEMMSVDDLLDRLEDRFRLLTGGGRTVMPRHQTLRAAVDWGWRLLDGRERVLFRRLAVFPGSFQLAAVEAVCASTGHPAASLLGLLGRLVDKSLVVPEVTAGGRTQYRMLETIRQYAAERLVESGEESDLRSRHAEHFLWLAERAERFERRPAQPEWLAALEAAHDDLRAALAWWRAHDAGRLVRLANALGWFWIMRGHLGEGREWLEDVIESGSPPPRERARALYRLARLAFWQGDYGVARGLAERCIARCRELGEGTEAGWALNLLGSIFAYCGDYQRGRACIEEVVATATDEDLLVDALIGLGEVLLQQRALSEARGSLERALTIRSGADARWQTALGVLYLGIAAFFERDYPEARRRAAASLRLFHEMGNRYALSGALDTLAAVALVGRDPERALRLCGAAAGIRERMRGPLAPRWREIVRDFVVQPARAAVGEGADAAWAAGERLTVDEAVALALETPARRVARRGPLSHREREVARLVARGMANREIARRLGIAERTVEGHLERMRAKLAVHSRTQIAVWVVEQGGLQGS